jgi:hypothetical protein
MPLPGHTNLFAAVRGNQCGNRNGVVHDNPPKRLTAYKTAIELRRKMEDALDPLPKLF